MSKTGRHLRHVSPLRYPGGKAALADLLAQTIELNELHGCKFFEPFAGGAGAALRLLLDGVISELYLNDLDPCIAAFWAAAVNESERFVEAILTVPVDTREWYKQREIVRSLKHSTTFELGFAAFYLNRCNRSGVIVGAAPIGGYAQNGQWKIGARFYRERLAERIRTIASMRNQIHITGLDAQDFLAKHLQSASDSRRILVYLDPPYNSMGDRLYMNSYTEEDHRSLAKYLQEKSDLWWVMSYDDTELIRRLYSSCKISDNLLQYSLHRKRKARELLIAPQHVRLPQSTDGQFDLAIQT